MNILPKKKWHVRTKENIARVRKDQKKAAEQEQQQLERALLAQNERRIALLRIKDPIEEFDDLREKASVSEKDIFGTSSERPIQSSESKHINFFQDIEEQEPKSLGQTNQAYEEEKKKEKKEYESKLGIMKYLGEGSHEYDKKAAWYEQIPLRMRKEPDKEKQFIPSTSKPPITLSDDSDRNSRSRKKHKKEKKKKHKKEREPYDKDTERRKMLERMREDRIRRERLEAVRTNLLLHPERAKKPEENKRKYNSQFFPEFSK